MFHVDSIPTSHAIFRYHIIDDRNVQKRNINNTKILYEGIQLINKGLEKR